ncbi:uncharacterized protein DUF5018 [Arcicella aurantiaca]|uniref:Uncharacterized protein DUF5018 n=1 Tax=Arcicella aurantiaca TaxID=591202 RepID=A0A316E827_9BACT|nr:DUF5018 domain-containing protein [Arcicella aurantiaca]PWK26521.1 uncharacterized protein DUF5018 [Arcicella aurantiaca]
MKNLTKTFIAIYVVIMCFAVACKKDEPTPTTTTPAVKSAAKDITKFSFSALSPVVEATIDATTKAITATVPAGTDVTKLVPTITISDKATISPATGVAQDFSKEVSYTVTAEDGGMVVWKVNVTKLVVAQSCQLIGITVDDNNGTLNETFEYDNEKRLIKRTSKNTTQSLDTKIAYTYDNDGFLIQIAWEKMNSKSASDNFKRVSSYTYKNGRLILQEIKQTANSGTVSTGSSTYEYESETSDKLKKVVYKDVVTGNATPDTFIFTNGILSSWTDPYNKTNTINAMGLVTKSAPQNGQFVQEWNYDANGQPIKYGYVPVNIEVTYTNIKAKYDDFELLTRGQYYPSIFWLAQDAETVFNPKGFKGFPNFKIFFSLTDKGTYLRKTYKSGTDVRTYDYKTDVNGNVTSYTITYANGFKDTGTFTYKCN